MNFSIKPHLCLSGISLHFVFICCQNCKNVYIFAIQITMKHGYDKVKEIIGKNFMYNLRR